MMKFLIGVAFSACVVTMISCREKLNHFELNGLYELRINKLKIKDTLAIDGDSWKRKVLDELTGEVLLEETGTLILAKEDSSKCKINNFMMIFDYLKPASETQKTTHWYKADLNMRFEKVENKIYLMHDPEYGYLYKKKNSDNLPQ